MSHIDVDSLDGEQWHLLDYEEQATVKRLMARGLASLEVVKPGRYRVVRIANNELQAFDRPQRGNQRSPFGIGG